jgi:hypothetical protein
MGAQRALVTNKWAITHNKALHALHAVHALTLFNWKFAGSSGQLGWHCEPAGAAGFHPTIVSIRHADLTGSG